MKQLNTRQFDQATTRRALARIIIKDEHAFRMVELLGFREFCATRMRRFKIPSKQTMARDCFEMFVTVRMSVKKLFQLECRRVCPSTDTWTSNQTINYMCITAHFIDLDWTVQKIILNFCPISNHRGEIIGKAIEKCLNDWGIEKVMTITVDNASSNDTAIAFLKKRLINWPDGCVLIGEFLQMRYFAHCFNVVCSRGFEIGNYFTLSCSGGC